MDATETPTKQWTRYTSEQQAEALVTLEANGGNVEQTANDTGIPASTIRTWRDATVVVPAANIVAEHRRRRAARWDEVQDLAVTTAIEKLPQASARDAAIVAGIAVDKAAILRQSDGPAPTAETDARIAELQALFGALVQQRAAVTVVHVHTQPPTAPPPITLSPAPESQG